MGPPSPHCRYAPALSTSHSPGLGPSSWAGAGPGSRGSGLGAQAGGVLVLSAPVLPRGPASVLQPLGLDVPSVKGHEALLPGHGVLEVVATVRQTLNPVLRKRPCGESSPWAVLRVVGKLRPLQKGWVERTLHVQEGS